MSKEELSRLGERFAASDPPAAADLADLEGALAAYRELLDRVAGQLRDLGFTSSTRVKTTNTMVDKLRRTRGMHLSRVQNLAGARIVVADLAAQDSAAGRIAGFYASRYCRTKIVDRRADPRFGYRAVHIVTRIDDMPVEIQVRTALQDTWAQLVERLADRWGRDIRYGQEPQDPSASVLAGSRACSRSQALSHLMKLSESILRLEGARAAAEGAREQDAPARAAVTRHLTAITSARRVAAATRPAW